MPAKRVNPRLIKIHRSYTVEELARRLGVHKNTVRNWQARGLLELGGGRPTLFHGGAVRAFLEQQNARRKRPSPPGEFYCFGCRAHRPPALGMVDYVDRPEGAGNLSALCEACGTLMHRRAAWAALAAVMPGLAVTIREADPRLMRRPAPSANCDFNRRGPT